jgi:hypothetical protein
MPNVSSTYIDATGYVSSSHIYTEALTLEGTLTLNNAGIVVTTVSSTYIDATGYVSTTDIYANNDVKLNSDGAVLSLGAGNDFTITHDGITGATLAGNPIIINSGAALSLDSTGAIETNATTFTADAALAIKSTTGSAITLDSGTTGIVNVGTSNNAKTINIGTGTDVNTINIGTENTAIDVIAIGSAKGSVTMPNVSSTYIDATGYVSTTKLTADGTFDVGGGTELAKIVKGNIADGNSGWNPNGGTSEFTITADAASVLVNSFIGVSVGVNGTAATCSVSTRTASTNFVVKCSANIDNGATLQYMIVN